MQCYANNTYDVGGNKACLLLGEVFVASPCWWKHALS